ncbi:MAG: aromatic ring-hydroxylating dioxygenase subunit alpha, partial [Alphaproteobacteria bacterium]|nr:aromatic ring-hydroxylating dioxygenase subunit alpha [Alphaproteobacteria bacterium]
MNVQSKFTPPGLPGPTYQEILERDGDAPSVLRQEAGIPQGTAAVPLHRYTSQAFFDLEMEKMWRKVWQFACREEHVPEVGDYTVYDIGRHSIVIVRAEDG